VSASRFRAIVPDALPRRLQGVAGADRVHGRSRLALEKKRTQREMRIRGTVI